MSKRESRSFSREFKLEAVRRSGPQMLDGHAPAGLAMTNGGGQQHFVFSFCS